MPENEAARVFIGALRERIAENKHFVVMIVGEPRSGKSYSALRIAELVDRDFSLENLVYSPDEFLARVIASESGDVIVFDEAGVNIFARDWQSKMNKALAKIFQILGYKHLGIILTFPSVMFVDKAVRRLFNYILLAEGFDREKEISYCKAYYNLHWNYILGTEILKPFTIYDKEHGRRIESSDLVFHKPKLAPEYEKYAARRKDQLLWELEQDIIALTGDRWEDVGDSVAYFIAERVQKAPNGKITKKDLYRLYLQFCNERGLVPVGKKAFGAKLKAILNVEEKKSGNHRYWLGIVAKT
jgi:hypothetical protein